MPRMWNTLSQRPPLRQITRRQSARAVPSRLEMTKANLIDEVARTTDHTKKEAEQIVDAVLEAVAGALERGEKIDLRGFGSFQVSGKKERQGRNPKTGEAITIAARNAAVFKPSKELAQRVNGTMATDGPADDAEHAQPSEGSTKLHGDKINT